MKVEETTFSETPKISFHTIHGIRSAKTIHIQGSLKHVIVYILIDSGSTHAFLSEKLAKKVFLRHQLGR